MYVVYQLSFEAAHYSVEISNVSSLQIFTGSKLSPELIPSFLATAAPMNKSSTIQRRLRRATGLARVAMSSKAEGEEKKTTAINSARGGLIKFIPTRHYIPHLYKEKKREGSIHYKTRGIFADTSNSSLGW